MRAHYGRQLQHLNEELLRMGSRVEHALKTVGSLLENPDTDLARRVIAEDREIDDARSLIEEHVLDIIATQQPVATDLRRVLAVIAIANELERAADYTKGIAKRIIRGVSYERIVEPSPKLRHMAAITQEMLNISLDAFVHNDAELARSLSVRDEDVDALEDEVIADLLQIARSDSSQVDAVITWLDVAHVLERLADRATNIGERVIFIATSHTEELNA